MSIVEWLFGKKPKINFTKDGKTTHDLDPKKWEAWQDRYRKGAEYDWKSHRGSRGKNNATPTPTGTHPKK